ncbi:MAG: recombinase RecT [Planctomycetota bacterium]
MSVDTETGLVTTDKESLVVITKDQVTLIKETVAKDATDAELALFFYDCRRRGVHPLDKLLYFTRRRGKYTPITSIDFMRARAAATREHMGTDDAVFEGTPKTEGFSATVTVYRLVQGQRCAFTATARWAEYVPESANNADAMWQKMPHGQLGKCAEALALRKACPQELEGLHTIEEMDQIMVEPANPVLRPPQRRSATPAMVSAPTPEPVIDAKAEPVPAVTEAPADPPFDPRDEQPAEPGCTITLIEAFSGVKKVEGKPDKPWQKWAINLSDGRKGGTFDTKIRDIAVALAAAHASVDATIEMKNNYSTIVDLWEVGRE